MINFCFKELVAKLHKHVNYTNYHAFMLDFVMHKLQMLSQSICSSLKLLVHFTDIFSF